MIESSFGANAIGNIKNNDDNSTEFWFEYIVFIYFLFVQCPPSQDDSIRNSQIRRLCDAVQVRLAWCPSSQDDAKKKKE